MTANRRTHLVLVATAYAVLLGFCFGPALLAEGPEAGSVTIQVTPSSVPESGGELGLLAIVRDTQGRPLPNAKVNFVAETGTLGSGGRLVTTGTDGEAVDRLIVTAAELATLSENNFRLAAAVGSGVRGLVTENVGVRIQLAPEAGFRHGAGGLVVAFDDVSEGHVTGWLWDFGDGATSTRQSPAHTFAEAGPYAVTLRVANSAGSDEVTRLVWVEALRDAGEQGL